MRSLERIVTLLPRC